MSSKTTVGTVVETVVGGDNSPLRGLLANYFPWILTVGIYAIAGFFLPTLFEVDTVQTVFLQSTAVTILAVGMGFALIVAEIDLSIVSVLLFAPTAGILAVQEFALPGIVALPLAVAIALVVGYINGFVITRIGVPSLIQTLAAWWALQGAVLSLTQGRTLATLPGFYETLGVGSVGPVRNLIILTVVMVAIAWFYSVRTVSGRRLFLVGGDPDSASRMGINAAKYRRHAFLISAIFAAIGGIALIARVGVISSGTGSDVLMPAIAAPVIAGVSLFGGTGKIINVPAGSLLVQLILTITRVAGISGYEFQLVQGLLVFVAVVLMELKRQNSFTDLLPGGA